MSQSRESFSPEYDLAAWEKALTINVGTAYACRECGNLVMVTKGGIGIMELVCCDLSMEKIEATGQPRRKKA